MHYKEKTGNPLRKSGYDYNIYRFLYGYWHLYGRVALVID